MSIKSKVYAAAATLTLVGGVGAFTAGAAHAATPSCGTSCVDIFSRSFDSSDVSPNFVVDSYRQGDATGQPVILFPARSYDPAEDFSVADQGSVADFYASGMVSPAVALHYGCIPDSATSGGNFPDCNPAPTDTSNLEAYEFEYAPFGVDSGMCMGVGTVAAQGTKVALEPCGDSSKTVWIVDTRDASAADDGFFFGNPFVPLINGSDTNFSHPFVLTYPKNGYPTDKPRPQLEVTNLTGFTEPAIDGDDGPAPTGPEIASIPDNQLWSAIYGVLP